jgi:glycosyltransferase involved in cell wall biosynthesis
VIENSTDGGRVHAASTGPLLHVPRRTSIAAEEASSRVRDVASAPDALERVPTGDESTISIVVRALNEEVGLPILLEGLRAQRERNFELVVVDSGSTDRTRQIARAVRDVPVTLLDLERFSYGRALNTGLAAARGRYVAFLSAHVQILSEDWLGEMRRACSRPRVAGAFSRQVAWSSSPYYERLFVWWMYGRHVRLPGLAPFSFTNAATMIRRDCWVSRPFDESLAACEDYDWALGTLRDGFRLVWVPQVRVRHSHHESFRRFLRRRWREGRALARIIHGHIGGRR